MAIDAVTRLEVAFEIGAPDIVGGQDLAGGLPRMANVSAVSGLGHQAISASDITDGGARWSRPAWMTFLENGKPFLGAPRRVMTAQLNAGLRHMPGRLMGAGMGLA